MRCRGCGCDLPVVLGPVRRRLYCSPGCRRAMEYERRRLQRNLISLEELIWESRLGLFGRKPEKVPVLAAEHARLQARLRKVLDDEEPAR